MITIILTPVREDPLDPADRPFLSQEVFNALADLMQFLGEQEFFEVHEVGLIGQENFILTIPNKQENES